MKEQYGRSLQILLGGLRAGAADRLRQRRQPAARARGRAPRPDRRAAGDRRVARGRSSRRRSSRACCSPSPAASPGCSSRSAAARLLLALAFASATLPADQTPCRRRWCWRSRSASRCVTGIVFGAAPAWFATRTDPIDALRGAGRSTRRSLVVRAQGAARRAGHALGRAGRRRRRCWRAASATSSARTSAIEVDGRVARVVEPAAGDLHAPRSWRRCIATSRSG